MNDEEPSWLFNLYPDLSCVAVMTAYNADLTPTRSPLRQRAHVGFPQLLAASGMTPVEAAELFGTSLDNVMKCLTLTEVPSDSVMQELRSLVNSVIDIAHDLADEWIRIPPTFVTVPLSTKAMRFKKKLRTPACERRALGLALAMSPDLYPHMLSANDDGAIEPVPGCVEGKFAYIRGALGITYAGMSTLYHADIPYTHALESGFLEDHQIGPVIHFADMTNEVFRLSHEVRHTLERMSSPLTAGVGLGIHLRAGYVYTDGLFGDSPWEGRMFTAILEGFLLATLSRTSWTRIMTGTNMPPEAYASHSQDRYCARTLNFRAEFTVY